MENDGGQRGAILTPAQPGQIERLLRWLAALVFACAALALRYHHLDGQPLWNDEMFSLDVIGHPFREIQGVLVARYHHPPLFFYCARLSSLLFGDSAWALRLPSAIFGALSVGMLPLIHRRGVIAGSVAALFLCVAPFHIAYSQEGRPYALAGFLALLSCWIFSLLLDRPTRLRVASYAAATAALLWTHHWGVFVVASHVAIAFLRKPVRELKPLAAAWVIVGLSYLPELAALRTQAASGPPTQWFWAEGPSPGGLFDLAAAFGGTYFKQASALFALPPAARIAGAAAFVAILLSVFLPRRPDRTPGSGLLLGCAGLTLLLPWLVSFVKPEIFLWYRYTVIVFPILALAAGDAIFRWKGAGAAVTAAVLAVGLWGTGVYFSSWEKSNVREVAAYVDSAAVGDAAMIIRPKEFAPLLNYYYRGKAVQYDEAYLETPLGGIVDTAAAFVYVSLDVPNTIRDYMDGHFLKVAERRFPGEAHMGIVVDVYRQKPEE